jgi:SSS family solute:Na+ symporter
VEDFYRKLRPQATDQRRLRIAKCFVAVFGVLAAISAIQLGHTQGTALSLWYTISAIVAGGLAGLFLLGFLSTRANQHGAYLGIVASLMCTTWATLTLNGGSIVNLGKYNFPLHDFMIGAVGHLVLLMVGYLASLFFHSAGRNIEELTLWGWLRRDSAEHQSIERRVLASISLGRTRDSIATPSAGKEAGPAIGSGDLF